MKTTNRIDIKKHLDRAHAIDPAIQAMVDFLHGTRTEATPSPAWFSNPDQITLELLVKTAASVRPIAGGESEAVEMALRIIDLSGRALEFNRQEFERKKQFAQKLKELGLEGRTQIPYRDGIAIITGQDRADRAEEDFLLLLEALEKDHPTPHCGVPADGPIKKDISARNTGFEKYGFLVGHLVSLQMEYDALRDRGQLGKKRRPKKGLDAESFPKSATNLGKPAKKKRKAAGK